MRIWVLITRAVFCSCFTTAVVSAIPPCVGANGTAEPGAAKLTGAVLEVDMMAAARGTAGDASRSGSRFLLAKELLWKPGSVVTVAFQGGSPDQYGTIAEIAREWTGEANIKFDFGYDEQAKTYRTWTTGDKEYAADIRIALKNSESGSKIGTCSRNPKLCPPDSASMVLPLDLSSDKQTARHAVLHEFGHALGFLHENQHPYGRCGLRWEDDPGYEPTRNDQGAFIVDAKERQPGIYRQTSGAPYFWSKEEARRNLALVQDYPGFLLSKADKNSVMMYCFPPQFYKAGADSPCYCKVNYELSELDQEGIIKYYP